MKRCEADKIITDGGDGVLGGFTGLIWPMPFADRHGLHQSGSAVFLLNATQREYARYAVVRCD